MTTLAPSFPRLPPVRHVQCLPDTTSADVEHQCVGRHRTTRNSTAGRPLQIVAAKRPFAKGSNGSVSNRRATLTSRRIGEQQPTVADRPGRDGQLPKMRVARQPFTTAETGDQRPSEHCDRSTVFDRPGADLRSESKPLAGSADVAPFWGVYQSHASPRR